MTAPLARVEDAALLCGQGRFLDDLDTLPGALTAAIVRSPHPHARIHGIDAAAARNAPGVVAVIGPDDVAAELRPFPLSVKAPMPYYAGATSRARFVGEPVAVVVATDRYLAEDAAELVQVGYEPLPSVTDTAAALAGDAPRLHEDAPGNVATDRTFSFGPVERPSSAPTTWSAASIPSRATPPCRWSATRSWPAGRTTPTASAGRRGVGQLPRAVLDGARAGRRARPAGFPAPAACARRHRRQLRMKAASTRTWR